MSKKSVTATKLRCFRFCRALGPRLQNYRLPTAKTVGFHISSHNVGLWHLAAKATCPEPSTSYIGQALIAKR